ncbi:MAG TPA: DUF6285 domain-containing protein [Candidatus Binatia bacterium]|nr:DUF6285 domain-containing protein [Candidatus Binatia bacterium]
MMQDRPTISELMQAVVHLLDEELVPNLTGSRQFYSRVAANVLRTVVRELEREDEQLAAEWERLEQLLSPTERPTTRAELREAIGKRTEELCQRIRQGDAETGPYRDQVLAHVRETVREKLLVSNPGWLNHPAS